MPSPTARTLTYLRQCGYLSAVVEKWNAHVGIRQDLFGFADVLAVHPARREIALVQVTTDSHVADRLAKAKARPELAGWLRAGGLFQVHGWARHAGRWEVRIVAVQAKDLADMVVQTRPRRGRRPTQPSMWS